MSTGSGTKLQQTLRCASDSYKVELSSDVVSDGAQLSGTWSGSSRGISGSLQGRSNSGHISVVAEGAGFSANLDLTTRGNRQSFSIGSKGDIRNVAMTMVRNRPGPSQRKFYVRDACGDHCREHRL